MLGARPQVRIEAEAMGNDFYEIENKQQHEKRKKKKKKKKRTGELKGNIYKGEDRYDICI